MKLNISIKFFILLSFFIFLINFNFAYQANLEEFGFKGLLLENHSKKVCAPVSIDLSSFNEQGEGILSLNAKFDGVEGDSSFISVKINEDDELIFWPEYFSKNGYARVFLPNLSTQKIDLEICLVTGGATEKAELLKTSFVGLYDTPVLEIDTVSPESIFLGEKARMKIFLKNNGSKDANYFVQFVSKDLRTLLDITSFDIIDGSSSATGIIRAGETQEFEFAIIPSKISAYNLPNSIVKFTNIFGEEQIITSKHPQLLVLDPKQIKLNLTSFDLEEKLKLVISVENKWDELFEGDLIITPSDLVVSSVQKIKISPKSEKEIILITDKLLPGDYTFLATIKDTNNSYSSNSVSYSVKNNDLSFGIILAIFGIICATAVFFIINSKKVNQKIKKI
ncbi:MAG TPA: hypothetical protein PKK60_00650 [archaeon]|nr:hypothetical protein [archaeon]